MSIIVPCYNQAIYLNDSLQSVLDQSYSEWECIIVNDGSPDDTDIIAKQWCESDHRFKYLKKLNGGLASARNAGIELSEGIYILPLDADDILHPEFLELLVAEIELNPKLILVSCYTLMFESNKENIVHELRPNGTTYHALLFENILMTSSLFRRSSWKSIGGYDERMRNGFEDWDFWLNLTKNGGEFKIVDKFLFYYRRKKSSMLLNTLKFHRYDIFKGIIMKNRVLYLENFDNTVEYFLFLVQLLYSSQKKYKNSFEYRIGRLIMGPYRIIKKLFGL